MSDMISLPLFDGTSVALLSDASQLPSAANEALRRFAKLTPNDRLSITPHVYAYYHDMHTHAGGSWIDEAMPRPTQPHDIWQHVRPLSITVKSRSAQSGGASTDDPMTYVLLEANCDWEEEHGLLLSWRGGHELVKVGEFDDRPVHRNEVPAGIIYHSGYDDGFSTFRTP